MSLSFLPGRPNDTQQSTCQAFWKDRIIFAYCSGNNVIILSNEYTRLQTIYLQADSVAVDINPINGFIAVGFSNYVYIYKPIHEVMKNPKWDFCCKIYHDDSQVNSLSWGNSDDLVVGSQYLSFWKIKDEFGVFKPILLWNKRQPKPVYICKMSEDSQLLASFGKYDHTVKLWKRISISGDQDIFSLTLLPHSAPVTTIRWKKSCSKTLEDNPEASQVIYTLCTDKRLRVWSCYEMDSVRTVQQWGMLQLSSDQKYCLIIDSWILRQCLLTERLNSSTLQNHPDLVLLGTTDGHFEVYLLTGLSNSPPKPMAKQRLLSAHVTHSSFVTDPEYLYFAEVQPYDNRKGVVSIVVHDLRGVIRQSSLDLSQLIEQKKQEVGKLEHKLTGHNKSIQRLIRSSDGEAMLTISRFSENCVWCPQETDKVSLHLKNIINTEAPIKLAVIHEKGQLVICLLENSKIQAWECPNDQEEKKASFLRAEHTLSPSSQLGDPILMLNTPEARHSHERHFVALIYRDGSVKAFEVSFLRGICEIESESLNIPSNDIYRISTIDPVHRSFFSNRPLISLITKAGVTRTYKAVVNYDMRHIKWIKTFELNTNIENITDMRGSSTGKLCIVHSTGKVMSLWDMKRGVLEYEESFEDTIKDIDWTSTAFGQSIVSIGFTGYALLYTQLRYDYTNNNPSYLPIEKIDITSHTDHNIGDSIWLKDGIFVVASGNQFYIKDKYLDLEDPFTHRSIGSRKILSNDILHLSSVLNGPLPVYHPQFLIQCLYANKLQLVKELLLRLFLELRKLNFRSEDLLNLNSNLDIEPYKFFIHHDKDYPKQKFPDPYPEYNQKVSLSLAEQLTKTTLPYLTRHQQITLITVIEAVDEIMKNESIVDYNGIRFLLGVRLFLSHKNVQKNLLMRDVTWALHSDNKELLLSIFDSHIISWERAREYKITYWLKEVDLIRKFEQIAKHEFSREDKRDPSRCAIFYLALKKKQILISLWKMSVGHSEQQKMLKFLSNDFSEQRWKSAALKNAFVLLSKHRFMDAACFFLLAGSLEDSANVLLKQVQDMDLAIGVCRIYEGDNGPALGKLLSSQVLPGAIMQNDRWMTSFIYWKLRKQDVSIRALMTAPINLENNTELVDKSSCVNMSFLVEDPALLVLYSHLRKRNIKYFLGSLEVENTLEYHLVLRVTDILRRMGCEYLAVSLVKNWEFIEESKRIGNLLDSPKKARAYSGIDSMIAEPTTTNIVRASLFDKFNDTNPSSNGSKYSNSPTKNVASPNKNMLEDFVSPLKNSVHSKNMLDDFSADVIHSKKPSSPPNNLLEGFSTASPHDRKQTANGQKSLLDDAGNGSPAVREKLPVKETGSAPRNLLDDFL